MTTNWERELYKLQEEYDALQVRLEQAGLEGVHDSPTPAGGAASEQRRGIMQDAVLFEGQVRAFAKEHNVTLGAAYEVLGRRGSASTGKADDSEEGDLEVEVRAYATEHKCSLGEAYVVVGAKHAWAARHGAREEED